MINENNNLKCFCFLLWWSGVKPSNIGDRALRLFPTLSASIGISAEQPSSIGWSSNLFLTPFLWTHHRSSPLPYYQILNRVSSQPRSLNVILPALWTYPIPSTSQAPSKIQNPIDSTLPLPKIHLLVETHPWKMWRELPPFSSFIGIIRIRLAQSKLTIINTRPS